MIKIACVGAGYWGKNLIRNFHQIGVLSAICDGNQQVLNTFSEQYKDCLMFSDLDSLLARENIDAVSIATPAETHAEIIERSLKAGKHVYVEKPLCLDESEAERLIKLAESLNKTLMVGHLLQYHPCYIEIKRIIKEGILGDLRYVYSNRLNIGLLRKEENVLWSFAPHDISMILGLIGSMPKSVRAVGSEYLTEHVADICVANLEFDNNVNAHIFVSWLNPFKEQKLTIVCEKGMLVFDDTLSWDKKLTQYDHCVEWNNDTPKAVKGDPIAISFEAAEPLKNECEHFVQSIKDATNPRTDGKEGLRVLKVLNQIQQAMARDPYYDE